MMAVCNVGIFCNLICPDTRTCPPNSLYHGEGSVILSAARTRDAAGEMAEQVEAVAATPYPELNPQVLYGVSESRTLSLISLGVLCCMLAMHRDK